jgi:hypothetical protein
MSETQADQLDLVAQAPAGALETDADGESLTVLVKKI